MKTVESEEEKFMRELEEDIKYDRRREKKRREDRDRAGTRRNRRISAYYWRPHYDWVPRKPCK